MANNQQTSFLVLLNCQEIANTMTIDNHQPPRSSTSENISANCWNDNTTISRDYSEQVPLPLLDPHSRVHTPESKVSRHIVDHDHHYADTPTTTRRKLIDSQKDVKRKARVIKTQKQQLQRLHKKVTSQSDIIAELRRKLRKHKINSPVSNSVRQTSHSKE